MQRTDRAGGWDTGRGTRVMLGPEDTGAAGSPGMHGQHRPPPRTREPVQPSAWRGKAATDFIPVDNSARG